MADENKGLMTREELALQMRNDAGQQAAQLSVSDRQMVYLCQGLTPEVGEGKAKLGDFYLRAHEHNFGSSFTAVIIGIDCFYTKWEGPKGQGRIVWSVLEEMVPLASARVRADCAWSGPDGKTPPLAHKTWQLALIHVKDGKLDPQNFGVFYAALAITAEKQGREIAKLLKRQATRENNPSYKLVMRFNSFDEQNDKKQPYKNWEANIATVLAPDKFFEILAVAAKESQIYQQARAQAVAKFASMAQHSGGAAEARIIDAQVDREAEEEYAAKMADKVADEEAARAKANPADAPPF